MTHPTHSLCKAVLTDSHGWAQPTSGREQQLGLEDNTLQTFTLGSNGSSTRKGIKLGLDIYINKDFSVVFGADLGQVNGTFAIPAWTNN